MILTLLEFPFAVLHAILGERSKLLKKIIKKMNKLRRKSLDKYGEEDWVWRDYDGEYKYDYLERHKAKNNFYLLLLIVVFIVATIILNHFGITLD